MQDPALPLTIRRAPECYDGPVVFIDDGGTFPSDGKIGSCMPETVIFTAVCLCLGAGNDDDLHRRVSDVWTPVGLRCTHCGESLHPALPRGVGLWPICQAAPAR